MDGQLAVKATEVLADVLIGVVSCAGAYAAYCLHHASAHIREKTATMKDQAWAGMVWRAVQQLDEVATKAVDKFEQTVAGDLRQQVKDGKVERAELLAIGKQAYVEVIETLGPETLSILQESFGDYTAHIKNTIESKVYQLKQEQAATGMGD